MNLVPARALLFSLLAGLALLQVGLPETLNGQAKPVQLSLVTPVQIFPETDDIEGLRLNLLYGRNANVSGFDIGVANHATGDFAGIGVGAVNLVDGAKQGLQVGLYNRIHDGTGVQLGWGFGLAGVNQSTGRMQGFQLAIVNIGNTYEGFQLGLVNITEDMHGLQVGLVNIIRSKASLAFLPLVNWKFDGGSD